ncbi:hypothetical protein BDZ89DRAFT_1144509 [Hymenopellis radicata]|nr:hypothetical protein BDZ89DRAFT_1144509 [Hymenopellis radicata]
MSHRRGRKPKQHRNISGLRNQKPPIESPERPPSEPQFSPDWPSELVDDGSDDEWDAHLDMEDEFTLASEFLDDEVFLERLLTQAEKAGDKVDDEDWVPLRVRAQRSRRKLEGCKVRGPYKKGPDVASKAARTRRRYKTSIAQQTSLDAHAFTVTTNPKPRRSADTQSENEDELADDERDDRSVEMQSASDADDVEMDVSGTRSDGSAMSIDGSDPSESSSTDSAPDIPRVVAVDEESFHEWEMEAEYESLMFGGVEEIRPWDVIRKLVPGLEVAQADSETSGCPKQVKL